MLKRIVCESKCSVALAVLISCSGFGDDADSVPPPEPLAAEELYTAPMPELKSYELKNGLTVRVSPGRGKRMRYVHLVYRVGAIDDPAGMSGVAYLAQRILRSARGGEDRSVGALDVSPVVSAWTTAEETHFVFSGAGLDIDGVMGVIAAQLSMGCDEVAKVHERERRNVKREIAWRAENDEERIDRLIADTVYPEGHPRRLSIYGEEEEVGRVTPADVCKFIQRGFVPSSVRIAVTGDVRSEEVEAVIKDHLTPLTGKPLLVRVPPPSMSEPASDVRELKAPVVEPRLIVRVSGEGGMFEESDELAVQLASRVPQDVWWDTADVKDLWRFIGPTFSETGNGRLTLAVTAKDVDSLRTYSREFRKLLKDRMRRMGKTTGAVRSKDDFLAEIEYLSATQSLLWARVREVEDPQSLAMLLLHTHVGDFRESLESVLSSDRESVVASASQHLETLRFDTLLLVPDGSLGEEQVMQRMEGEDDQGLSFFLRSSAGWDLRDYGEIQAGTTASSLPIEDIMVVSLTNGLRVVLVKLAAGSTAYASLLLRGGLRDAPRNIPLIATYGYDWRVGDADMHKKAKNPRLVGLSDVEYLVSSEYSTMGVSGGAVYSERMLELLAKNIEASYDSNMARMALVMRRFLLGDSGCISSVIAGASLQRIVAECRWGSVVGRDAVAAPSPGLSERRSVESFRDVYFRPGGATLLVAGGGLDIERVLEYTETVFGEERWKGEAPPPPVKRETVRPRKTCIVEENERISAVTVDVVFPIGQEHSKDYVRLKVAEAVLLAEMGVSERAVGFFRVLGAELVTVTDEAYFRVQAVVENGREGQALADIWTSIDNIKGDGLFDNRVERARRQVRVRLDRALEDPEELVKFLEQVVDSDDFDLLSSEAISADVDGVSRSEVAAFLGDTLRRDRASLIIRGPKEGLQHFPECDTTARNIVLAPETRTWLENRKRERKLTRWQKKY